MREFSLPSVTFVLPYGFDVVEVTPSGDGSRTFLVCEKSGVKAQPSERVSSDQAKLELIASAIRKEGHLPDCKMCIEAFGIDGWNDPLPIEGAIRREMSSYLLFLARRLGDERV